MTANKDGNETGKKTYQKVLAIFLLAAVIVLIIYMIWKVFGKQFAMIFRMMGNKDDAAIEAYLNQQSEVSGLFSVFLMSVLQVVSIFVPGIAIQLAAGAIYGWFKSFVASYAGFVFGNVLVFYVARKLGDKITDILEMGKKANVLEDKVNNYSPFFVLMLAYLIPGIPNGFIPYFASRLDIRGKDFAGAVAGASWIQILCNCIAGHFLIRSQYLFMILSFAIQIGIIIFVAKKRDFFLELGGKKKKTEESSQQN